MFFIIAIATNLIMQYLLIDSMSGIFAGLRIRSEYIEYLCWIYWNLTRNCTSLFFKEILSSPDSQSSISLLALYVVLGVTAGGALLCWCCWAPGWFLWRVSVFRFLPCCNSCCASCQLCGRSCSQNKDHRLAKVTPEGAATPVSSTTTTVAV